MTGRLPAPTAPGALALNVSVVLALLVINPRLRTGRQDRTEYSTGYICPADADPSAITEALVGDHRAPQLQTLARIALTKMRLLRVAGDTAVVAIAAALFTR
ncbi:Pycsar system effector family protein [Streptomyces sp. NPDC004266]|uniref:Pycsar system effector family protein n=1 Tax=Streptomyces sp. NPDC004266 TaxID=3364693 RepID=UPI00368C0294